MGIIIARTRVLETSSGWPDASNTGVPAGTTLTPSGSVTTSSNGQIIQDLDIDTGLVVVNHANVTIRRCNIVGGIWCIRINSGGDNCTIEDCELDSQLEPGSNAIWQFNTTALTTVRRCNIHDTENGIHIDNNLDMQDCYIHDLLPGSHPSSPHSDGAEVVEGSSNVILHHNRFVVVDATSCVNIYNESGTQVSDWYVTNNKLSGGSFCIYGPRFAGATNVYINNNRLRDWVFGPGDIDTDFITEATGNVNDDTGDPINF